MATEFKKTPKQEEAIKLLGDPTKTNILLSGGVRCISGDTRVLTNRGYIPVRQLHAEHKPFVVRSYNEKTHSFEWVMAEAPFVKGKTTLLQITLTDGRQFHCTPNHRVLSSSGYKDASALACGETLVCQPLSALDQKPSISDTCLSKLLQDGRRYFHKVQDSLAYCLERRHLYDVQLPNQSEAVRVFVPSHNDEVTDRTYDHSYHVANQYGQSEYSPSSFASHPDMKDAYVTVSGSSAVIQRPACEAIYVNAPSRFLCLRHIVHTIHRHFSRFCIQLLSSLAHDTRSTSFDALTPFDSPVLVPIASIVPQEDSVVHYDFTVPTYSNYVAEGVVHHNSGKTFILCYTVFVRAMKCPGSRHLMVRLRFNHAKQSLCLDTIPKMLRLCFPGVDVKLSKVDWYYTLPNGSEVWIGGLDDGDRVEKILGKEFCSIYFNESSQIDYKSVGIVKTRLAMKCDGLVNKLYFDCNPPNKRHWLYKIWIQGLNPEYVDATPILNPESYGYLRLNPEDNKDNLANGFMETTLSTLSERDKKRFRDGEFTDDAEGALFKWEQLCKTRVQHAPELYRIVVGVDPAVTANSGSNSTGIIVAGVAKVGKDNHYYILDDLTMVGTPYQWAKEVCDAYLKWEADRVIAEINQGGDLVERNLRTIIPDISYEPVRATRGKLIRAEPIAALCEKGQLHMVGEHPELENELTSWAPASGEPSPDRMDAMVWAVSALSGKTKRIGTW